MAGTPLASISLTDLLSPRSAQQVINDFFSYLANPPDPSLVSVRTANWRTGGPYRFLAYRQGIEASLLYQILAGFAGSSFLRFASGKWLDWLGEDFFSEPRQQATFATITETVTIPAGAGPYGPLQLVVQTSDGKQFISQSPVTLPAGPQTITVSMRAAQAGTLYNVGANTVNQLVSPSILGISVNNAADAAKAFDQEPDPRYRQRLAAKWGAITGTTAAAYVYWAMTASPEVVKVSILANNNAGVFANNFVTGVVGTAVGPVSSGALAAVDAYIAPLVPLDVTWVSVNAAAYPVTMTGTAKVFKPYVGIAAGNIATSLQNLAALIPIGSYPQGPVPQSEVERAIIYDQTQVYDVVSLVTSPSPIAPAYNDLVTFDSSGLTIVQA
jgi:hypothetical protein